MLPPFGSCRFQSIEQRLYFLFFWHTYFFCNPHLFPLSVLSSRWSGVKTKATCKSGNRCTHHVQIQYTINKKTERVQTVHRENAEERGLHLGREFILIKSPAQRKSPHIRVASSMLPSGCDLNAALTEDTDSFTQTWSTTRQDTIVKFYALFPEPHFVKCQCWNYTMEY